MKKCTVDVNILLFSVERDPSKRRVKPVQDHMLQLDFAGLGDSSDDSDFEVPKDKGRWSQEVKLYLKPCTYLLGRG